MNRNIKNNFWSRFGIPFLLLSLFTFPNLFAAKTNYYYIATEKTWQENENFHGHVDLREQSDETIRISECAYYCTARDSTFDEKECGGYFIKNHKCHLVPMALTPNVTSHNA